jgi:serine/threonine-protein kinase HipA
MALALGRACGFTVPATALVPMPDGLPPALAVERFDIREGRDDTRLLALEDFCSVLGVPTSAKYDSTMERVARAARPLSTAQEDDLAIILKRALFAWLIGDGDMHLKNLALLRIAEAGDETFASVRIASLYDVVTTRVFPRLATDHMALKLNGKDDNLKPQDFRRFSSTAGLRASAANDAIDGLIENIRHAVDHTSLPKLPNYGPNGKDMAEKMLEIVHGRLRAF